MDHQDSARPFHHEGFSTLEILVAIAVTIVLLILAVPTFQGLILDSRRAVALNDLLATLNYGRSEAVTRQQPVTVCRSADASVSAPTCGGPGWEVGWIAFVDEDGDGVRDAQDAVLRVHAPLPAGATLRGNTRISNRVTYRASGMTANNGRMVYCDRRGFMDDTRLIVVAITGRARVMSRAEDVNNAPLAGCLN